MSIPHIVCYRSRQLKKERKGEEKKKEGRLITFGARRQEGSEFRLLSGPWKRRKKKKERESLAKELS